MSEVPSARTPELAEELSGNLSATRRRELGSASARSTLLTVLGELAYPGGHPVWTATLIEALGALDIEEKSARQALTRTANEGVLCSERHGRRVLWDLSDHGRELLRAGTERIYGFQRSPRFWDGEWLVLSVPIPEAQRRLRHRLRTRLTWLGLGSPTSGVWISPDVALAEQAGAVVRSLGLEDLAFAWTGPAAGIGSQERLIDDAWDLDSVRSRYTDFLCDFEDRSADGDVAAYVAQVQMIEAWRRFPFLDPDLPAELLDQDWPGPRAAAVFHERHDAWRRGASAAWREFVRAGGPRP